MVAWRTRNLPSEAGKKLEIAGDLSGRIERGASERAGFSGSGLAIGDGRTREELNAVAKSNPITARNFPTGAIRQKRFSDTLSRIRDGGQSMGLSFDEEIRQRFAR